ncbi:MAG: protein kinase [Anaerolineae bacterium]|nr:protein kinase [Anaerolineae bacterium]
MTTQLIANRYEITGTIGHGGMGDVFHGTDTQTGEAVAIKLLKPDIVASTPALLERFEREGEALRQLDHPNIVKMLAAIEENEMHYLVMEYVSGGSLRDLLDKQPQLPLERVLNISLDLADALTRAHRLQIIHRDIKPANVLLAEDGTPRLTDFGVARLGSRTRMTETGSLIGTYAYLSPETCMGKELDARTDIWSFGVMLYEMLTGKTPFEADQSAAMLVAILQNPLPDPTQYRPDIPPALVNLLAQMLQKDRDQRIHSVRLVGAELEAIIQGIDLPLSATPSPIAPGQPIRSRFATPTPPGAEIQATPPWQTPASGPWQATPTEQWQATPTGQQAPSQAAPVIAPKKFKLFGIMLGAIITLAIVLGVVLALTFTGGDDSGGDSGGSSPVQTVRPVAAGEYMVLVANLEPLRDTTPRDVSRFIVDDLTKRLEHEVPFSNVRIRAYPGVITSHDAAQAAAEANEATVVVWGNYDDNFIELNVEIGVTGAFSLIEIPQETLERTVNMQARLTDERNESVAQYVLNVLQVLQTADGDGYESMRLIAIADELDTTNAEVISGGVPGLIQQAFVDYIDDTPAAIEGYTQALELQAKNPLLYVYRAAAYLRQGQVQMASIDLDTASGIGPDGWTMPLYLESLMVTAQNDIDKTIEYYEQIADLRPDDWFAHNYLAGLYYLNGNYEAARTFFARAIELGPNANFPYILSMMLALHEGRLADMQTYLDTSLSEFTDPHFSSKLMITTFGDLPNIWVPTFSAIGNLILGQYNEVVDATGQALQIDDSFADMYLVRGLAYCNLGDLEAAEAAYTRGIDLDPGFIALYALRAEVRMRQADMQGGLDDARIVEESDLGGAFLPLIEAGIAQEWSCETFLSYDYGQLANAPVTAGEHEAALPVVEPVEAGKYRVLVAQLEPLGGVQERDVTRFIVDDLTRVLEQETLTSNVRVREYPLVIASADEALNAATLNEATVVVWGNYSPEYVELEVQIGVTSAFDYIAFDRDMLERTANVRVHLADERQQSIAPQVMGVISTLTLADGNDFAGLMTFSTIINMDVTGGEVVGNAVAARVHRAFADYIYEPASTVEEITAAIELDAGNPLLYIYRVAAVFRSGSEEGIESDLTTAQKLGPENWAMPLFLGIDNAADSEEVLEIANTIVDMRPDDWYAYYTRGSTLFMMPDRQDEARQDLDRAIELEPDNGLPYLVATLLALRQGRITDAQAYAHTILAEYPDANLMKRTLQVIYGTEAADPVGIVFAAMTQTMLGQYEEAQAGLDELMGPYVELPEETWEAMLGEVSIGDRMIMADMTMWNGLTVCNLYDYEAAEEFYRVALQMCPDYDLVYMLRGSVRLQLGSEVQAAEDFTIAQANNLEPDFNRWVTYAMSGDWNCHNFFDYTPPEDSEQ